MPIDRNDPNTIPSDGSPSAPRMATEMPSTIGPYKILQVLGEGGMGIVYEAEQVEPVRRRVALKIIKLGMDTKQVVARFEAERQALAVMDNPGIAKVLDGGATETGRPYFVMELVKGISLIEYCDLHKLTTTERLKLFIELCDAIQHAHQKGVIHRDLKPSNVLVSVAGSAPQPKVIDFGVAKACGRQLTEKTLVTQHGQIIGTPVYMSPEQAEMSGLDVDTRTDIYSLGVILYELLTGAVPYDLDRLGSPAGIPHVLRERETPTPSARLNSLGDDQRHIAKARDTDPKSLRSELSGDLDWIILKAMEKDRTRRYETANGLALDIQRRLRHEPVLARPPTARYRFSKFVRRNKVAVTASAAVVGALLLGAITATIGMTRARQAEQVAREEVQRAEQVSDFLVDLFRVADPRESELNTLSVQEILERGADRSRTALTDQPLAQSRLMLTIARVYKNLGRYDEATDLVEGVVRIRRSVEGERSLSAAEGLTLLGEISWLEGEYVRAESLLVEALDIQESALPSTHPDLGTTLGNLGVALRRQRRHDEAKPLLKRALQIHEENDPPDLERIASAANNLGNLYDNVGQFDSAVVMFQKAIDNWGRVDPNFPALGSAIGNQAIVYLRQQRYDEAEPLFLRSLEIWEQTLGPEHPNVARGASNLAYLYVQQERWDDAATLYEKALAINSTRLAPDHPEIGLSLAGFGVVQHRRRDYVAADTLFRRARAIWESSDPDSPIMGQILGYHAAFLDDVGRTEEAELARERAAEISGNER